MQNTKERALYLQWSALYILPMSGLVDDAKDAGDKMKAGAKAAGKKIEDPDRDASTEYNKEKVKEKVEDL